MALPRHRHGQAWFKSLATSAYSPISNQHTDMLDRTFTVPRLSIASPRNWAHKDRILKRQLGIETS